MASNLLETVPSVSLTGENPAGLFSAVAFRDNNQTRWFNGVQIEGNGSGLLSTYGAFDCDKTYTRELVEGADWQDFEPFTVYGTFKCSPVGYSPERAEARAVSRLTQFEEATAESVLWARFNDSTDGNEFYAEPLTTTAEGNAVTVPDTVDLTTAIGLLDHYVYRYYGGGVIHVPRHLAPQLPNIDKFTANRLTLSSGVVVVLGSGYGAPGESKKLVATPTMFGYRSGIEVPFDTEQVFDKGKNILQTIAERIYLIGWDAVGGAVSLTVS